jgi:parallel beta-helix repeat protein
MKRKVSAVALISTLLTLAFAVTLLVDSVSANFMPFNIPSHTIEITADGNVTGTDNIKRYGTNYEFTANVSGSIIVFCDNITIIGNGHSLMGNGGSTGLFLEGKQNTTIKNLTISNFEHGITYSYYHNMHISAIDYRTDSDCKNNVLIANNIINNKWGVYCYFAQNITISGNVISNNSEIGISTFDSGEIQIYGNTLSENNVAASFTNCDKSNVYGNNFINNVNQTNVDPESNSGLNFGWSTISWNNGRVGNFWSNYKGTDVNKDGVGDTPYIIDNKNTDRYPLIVPLTVPQPEKPQTELFPTALVTANVMLVVISTIVLAVITFAGLLVYFRRRKGKP